MGAAIARLRVPGDADGPPRTILLVNEGKFGAKDRVTPFDGRPVQVRGTLLARGEWRMLELAAGGDGLSAAELPEVEQAALLLRSDRCRGAARSSPSASWAR